MVLDLRPPANGAAHVGVDLGDARAAEDAVRRVAEERGRLDGIVCAAGIDACGPLDGIAAGDWVSVDTPHGAVRARARLTATLDPGVVVAQHGWWQSCDELGLPGYPPYGPDSANLNLVLRQGPSDAISGSSPLRASLCDVAPLVTSDGARG